MKTFLSAKFLTSPEKLRVLLFALVLGVFLGRGGHYFEYFLLGGGVLFFTAVVMKNYWVLLISIIVAAFAYGQIYNYFIFEKNELNLFYGKTVEIEGKVVSFPEMRESQIQVVLEIQDILDRETGNTYANGSERALLIMTPETEIQYGDFLQINGKITRPPRYKDFDYSKFLKKYGLQSIVRFPETINVLEAKNGGSPFILAGKKTRDFFSKTIEEALPIPHSTIAMGILLGVKKQLPDGVKSDFKQSALEHIIVVSGFNVTIVIFLLTVILRRFGKVISFMGVTMALFFFVFMTGAEAPVVRAGLMGFCVVFSVFIGRFSDVRNVFFFALALVAIISPKTLQYDMSLFLSSAATLGIVLGVPFLEKRLLFIPELFELRTLISVTLAAQIAVFPLLAFYFSEISLIGFISNLFVEPLIPLGMFFTFLIVLGGLFSSVIIIKILAIPAFVILEMIFFIAHFFGDYASVVVPSIIGQIALILIILGFLIGSFHRNFNNEFFIAANKH